MAEDPRIYLFTKIQFKNCIHEFKWDDYQPINVQMLTYTIMFYAF